jgi:ATP-binding cassette subfamily B multidrug efflux pump
MLEKGANLSLGEKQIIAFMRSIIHDPQILILDEATAHMDSITERWISRVSAEIFKNKTMLIIAHRLATLKEVNRILVLHHGELVETGTHQELLKRKGIYHRLYEIQFRKEHLENELPAQLLKEKSL